MQLIELLTVIATASRRSKYYNIIHSRQDENDV